MNWSLYTKFDSEKHEKVVRDHLVDTVTEETGDLALLSRKIYRYAKERGIVIENLQDIDTALSPREDEIKDLLIQQVRILSQLLEEEVIKNRKLNLEMQSLRAEFSEELASLRARFELLLEVEHAIKHLAQTELECEHIEEAKSLYWEKRLETMQ